jgi:hypothetical protein
LAKRKFKKSNRRQENGRKITKKTTGKETDIKKMENKMKMIIY